jgi:hypothetical protein
MQVSPKKEKTMDNRSEDKLIKLNDLMFDHSIFSRTFEREVEDSIFNAMHGKMEMDDLALHLRRLSVGLMRNTAEIASTIDEFILRIEKRKNLS